MLLIGRLRTRQTDTGSGNPHRRAALGFAVLIVVAVAAIMICVVVSTQVKSPAQSAAEAEPPTATVLTATVVRTAIHSTIVFRGAVANPRQYTATPTLSASAGAAQANGPLVVTAMPKAAGAQIHSGEVVIEVSGRPMVVLAGATPTYRDLRPGDKGKDVTALQDALRALGVSTGSDASGTYGSGTKIAVTTFYKRLGYPVRTAGDGAVLDAAKKSLETAERALAVLRAQPVAQESSTGASHATAVAWAEQDVKTAKEVYNNLLTTSGAMVPQSEVIFIPEFPVTVGAIAGSVGSQVSAKDPLVTLAIGAPVVNGRLNPTDASRVKAGQAVELTDVLRGFRCTGTVATVGALTSDTSANGGAAYVPVSVTAEGIPQNLVGDDVQLSVDINAGQGQQVLAVPQAAVFAQADGKVYVSVRSADGRVTRVSVTTGASGGGLVEVAPVSGDLKEGDVVVLGVA